jgi:threonine aldolase
MIDLRSDTVTRPTPAMREAIAAAAVGDDQFGEDPSINALQERVAELLGKQSALWLPTGTMANQVALRVLTRPGDDVIVSAESHAVWHETGGSAANAGVQFTPIGRAVKGAAGTRTAGTRTAGTRTAGTFTADEFLAAVKPRGHMIYPPTTLVEIENTHNRAGGVVFPQGEAERICEGEEDKAGEMRAHGTACGSMTAAAERASAKVWLTMPAGGGGIHEGGAGAPPSMSERTPSVSRNSTSGTRWGAACARTRTPPATSAPCSPRSGPW